MKTLIASALILLLCGTALAGGFSKPSNRTGKWELGLLVNQAGSWDVTGRNGSSIDVDSDTGWGFLIGYNFNEHFNLGFDYAHNAQDYSATVIPDTADPVPVDIHHTLDNDAFNFNFTYNILDKTFTPFINGGLGWTELDSNISDSEVSTGCWWDPWWGLICTPYYSTYGDTAFSYNVGAGLRWDVTPQIALKASVDYKRMNLDGISDNADMYVGRFTLLWMH